MNVRTVRWANHDNTAVIVNDEIVMRLADDPRVPYVRQWMANGNRPELFRDLNDARRIRVLEVKAEARRRILALVPGCTLENRDEKQINALMQAVLGMYDAVLAIATAVEALGADTAAARAILTGLAPMAEIGRQVVAIRLASDAIENLVMNSPANPISWEIGSPTLWPEDA